MIAELHGSAAGFPGSAGGADEALVAGMARRDEPALSSLYDRYRSVIFSIALRVLADRAEAEEVLTDVFMQAWRQAAAFDPRRGSVAGWLVTLCRSRSIDRLRARGRRQAVAAEVARSESERSSAGAATARAVEESEEIGLRRHRIERALATLPAAQRQAIELAYYGDLSHAEVAARLEEPLGTVKTRIRQGLIHLREKLSESSPSGPGDAGA